jgi:hypothetical protein
LPEKKQPFTHIKEKQCYMMVEKGRREILEAYASPTEQFQAQRFGSIIILVVSRPQ